MKTFSVEGILWILSLGAILQGFETSSMAVFIGQEYFSEYFNNPGSLLQGVISGSNPVGAFIGCWISGFVSDKYGRLVSMRLATVFWVIGSILSIFVIDITMLVIGRMIKGITIGIFSSLLPVYVSEVISINKRGLATSVLQWCLTWGIMIMFYISYFCSFLNNELSFRISWGVELIPGFLLLILSFLLPESPKWFALKLNWDKSNEILQKLKLKEEIKVGGNCSYLDLIKNELRPHLIIGVLTQTITQLTGIGVLMYYLIFICEMIGLKGEVKILSASIQYVVNVLFTIFPILFIDKLRRKDVLIYGLISLGVVIEVVGIIMGYFGNSTPPIGGNESVVWEVSGKPGIICLSLCFLFVSIFASTLSCVAWLYTNEIFPIKSKAKGSSICMSVSWTFNFLLTFLAPISLKHLKWFTFCLFGLFNLIGAVIVLIWFPETFGLKDEEIIGLFKIKEEKEEIIEIIPQTIRRTPLVRSLSARSLVYTNRSSPFVHGEEHYYTNNSSFLQNYE